MIEEDNLVRLVVRAKNNLLLGKRESLRFTQQQMADYCDVNITTYGLAERLQSITLKDAEKIALMLEMDLEKLFPNWLELFGVVVNDSKNYILLDNSYIQRQLENKEAFGGTKLLTESFHEDLDRALKFLNPREAETIKLYFGIGCISETLEEIGERFNVTRERVRQIKERAVRSLRHTENSEILSKYLGDSIPEIE